jgi:hypothetical protein
MGLAHANSFQPYHRVLNRNVWSGLEGARLLLRLLVALLAPIGPLVLGLDDTLERRRGGKIRAKGIDRDPVRSSRSHLVNTSGLRWLSLMLLVPIPRAQRVWAVPFLTVLAPSERDHQERGQRHKKLTDWVQPMLLVVRRWLPERTLVVVTGSSFFRSRCYGACVSGTTPSIASRACGWMRRSTNPLPHGHLGRRGAPACKASDCRLWPTS